MAGHMEAIAVDREVRAPEIPMARDAIEKAVAQLHDTIDMLESRIAFVLAPAETGPARGPDVAVVPVRSSLATELRSIEDRVAAAVRRLGVITAAVDL